MIKELWVNLPSKNISRSRDFYKAIGFSFNEKYGPSNDSFSLQIGGKGIIVMVFSDDQFEKFTSAKISDTAKGSEVLLSFDAERREEVDEMAKKVESAGGTVFSKPSEKQGWMYGFGFSDPDGHRWNMVYMDFSKMPGERKEL